MNKTLMVGFFWQQGVRSLSGGGVTQRVRCLRLPDEDASPECVAGRVKYSLVVDLVVFAYPVTAKIMIKEKNCKNETNTLLICACAAWLGSHATASSALPCTSNSDRQTLSFLY